MSIKLNHAGKGLDLNHDINVTPFIDVMLVLLIIFMITASVSTVAVPVQLPDSNASQPPPPDDPVYVTLQENLSISVGDTVVGADGLSAGLDRATGGNKEAPILLRADKSVNYQNLMDLLNGLRNAGYLNVALIGVGDPG